ncbi:hypothetical protein INT47_011262 [Mucor saturninus]|uniref:Uncharacterized protein n=1 Tax=Mucor saturninus TaxID=64648 RepID=A0A8H7VE30_9FUNG|nr:hypothetical protein INT47_011262 [Mucor saturninus]
MACKTYSSIFKSLFIQHRSFSATKTPAKVWTSEESRKLLDLVEIHGTNWVTIQQHFLDRNRKSLGGRYRSLMSKSADELKNMVDTGPQSRVYESWTKGEDAKLLALVEEHGMQWTKISQHFDNRTVSTVSQRYNRLTVGSKIKRGTWTPDENTQLQSLRQLYGEDYKHIASVMQSRTADQCRVRVKYLLSSPVSVGSLKKNQLENLREAVKIYGTEDFRLLIKKANLPATLNHEELRRYYWRELDPAIDTSEWTKEQVVSMVNIYNELDGCMELVQMRIPVKRSLKDMWTHYHAHVLNND